MPPHPAPVAEGVDPRPADRSLPQKATWRNAGLEQRGELFEAQLALMEGVGRGGRLAVGAPVGVDITSEPVRPQHALDLGHHASVVGDVLDHLERHDRAEAARLELGEVERARPTGRSGWRRRS